MHKKNPGEKPGFHYAEFAFTSSFQQKLSRLLISIIEVIIVSGEIAFVIHLLQKYAFQLINQLTN